VKITERLRHVKQIGGGGSTRSRLIIALKIAVTLTFMAVALRHVGLRAQLANWSSLHVGHMAVACLTILLTQVLAAVRWNVLLTRWEIALTFGQAFRLNMVGLFFNMAFPTSVGGDAVKAFFLARHSGKGPESVMSLLLARFLGIVVLLTIGLVAGVVFAWSLLPRWVLGSAAALIAAAILGAVVVLRSSWIGRWTKASQRGAVGMLRRALAALQFAGHDGWLMVELVILSFFIQIVSIHGYYEAALAIGMRTSYLHFLIFVPLTNAVAMVPVSIFGLGLRENSFAFFFALVGIAPALAVSMSLTWFLAYLLTSLTGGLFLLTLEESFFLATSARPAGGSEVSVGIVHEREVL